MEKLSGNDIYAIGFADGVKYMGAKESMTLANLYTPSLKSHTLTNFEFNLYLNGVEKGEDWYKNYMA